MYQMTGALDKQLCCTQQLIKVLPPLFSKDLIYPLNLFSRKIPDNWLLITKFRYHGYCYITKEYHIAGNFYKLKFSENSFQWIFFGKIFSKFSVIFSFFATGLKNFKALFCKKIFRKFLKFPKFPKIKFYENFRLYSTVQYNSFTIIS